MRGMEKSAVKPTASFRFSGEAKWIRRYEKKNCRDSFSPEMFLVGVVRGGDSTQGVFPNTPPPQSLPSRIFVLLGKLL